MLLLSLSEIDHFNITNNSRAIWYGFAGSMRFDRRNAASVYCYLRSGRAMIGARGVFAIAIVHLLSAGP